MSQAIVLFVFYTRFYIQKSCQRWRSIGIVFSNMCCKSEQAQFMARARRQRLIGQHGDLLCFAKEKLFIMTTTTTTTDLNVPEVVPAVLTISLYVHYIGMHTKTLTILIVCRKL
jgi:hypothetical protein